MPRHLPLAPAALGPYRPGQYSAMYHALPADVRQRVANAVDEVFLSKTGVSRKLSPHDVRDRPLVRQWLLIRDAIMAAYQYQQVRRHARAMNLADKLEADFARSILPKIVEAGGLPKPVVSSTTNDVMQLSHTIHMSYELLEISEFVAHHGALHEILLDVPVPAAVVGMPLAVVAGLMEIAEAHEAGDRDAERNAYRYGFACRLVYGGLRNTLPADTDLGEKQRLGDRAAQRLLDSLSPGLRANFLAAYRGSQTHVGENLNRALHDVGAQ